MTKKDFELIASVLKATRAPQHVVHAMAARLAATNPRFNSVRFVEACEFEPAQPAPMVRHVLPGADEMHPAGQRCPYCPPATLNFGHGLPPIKGGLFG